MVPERFRDLIPAEPPERSRTLDPRIAADFDRVRRRYNAGLATLLAMSLAVVLGAFALLSFRASLDAGMPSWFAWGVAGYLVLFVAVATATLHGWRCPSCHRYLYWPFYWPGTKIQLCRRCGIRLR